MAKVQFQINPTEVKSVKFQNAFSKQPGEKVNLSVKSEAAIKLNPTNPVVAVVVVKCVIADEDKSIELEVETLTGVVSSTFVDDYNGYIKKNLLQTILVQSNEKVRALCATIGAHLQMPNPAFEGVE